MKIVFILYKLKTSTRLRTCLPLVCFFIFFQVFDCISQPSISKLGVDFSARNPNDNHPRLMVHQSEIQILKDKIARISFLKNGYDKILASADGTLSKPLLDDSAYSLDYARTCVARIENLAYAYGLSKDTRYGARLYQELLAVSNFSTWSDPYNSQYAAFELANGELTGAVAIGYDWGFDYMNSTQRKTIRDAIINKSLTLAENAYNINSMWVKANHNWNFVCNTGILKAALALGKNYPNWQNTVTNVLKSIEYPLAEFSPDGGWKEGPTYWGYGTGYYAELITCLQSTFNTEYGYCIGRKGVRETAYFKIYSFGKESFNFGDADAQLFNLQPLWHFFGKIFKDYTLSTYRGIQNKRGQTGIKDIIWYDEKMVQNVSTSSENTFLENTNLPHDNYYSNIETAFFRNAWSGAPAYYVGFHNDQNNVNHGQYDAGNFVYDAEGVRWATETGKDSYTIPNYRSDAYRCRAEGHNVLVINPDKTPGQNFSGVPKKISYVANDEIGSAVYDLTSVYQAYGASKAQRGVALLGKKNLLIQDEIILSSSSTVYWFMHTATSITIATDGKSAILTQGTKKLKAILVSPSAAKFSVMNAEPLPTSPNPVEQSDNVGIKKLTVKLSGITSSTIAVYLAPMGMDDSYDSVPKLTTLDNWSNWGYHSPYGNTLPKVPGTIENENYDQGGNGFSYNDSDSANNGNTYRIDDVDISIINTGAYALSYVKSGEWWDYTFEASESANYNLSFYVANKLSGKTFTLFLDDIQLPNSLSIPVTGDYSVFKTTQTTIDISKGIHRLRIQSNADNVNLDKVNFSISTITSTHLDKFENTLNVFPNPNTGNFVIQYIGTEKHFIILNSSGQVVKEFEKNNFQSTVNLTIDPKGIYFIKIGTIIKKIIIE